MTGHTVVDVVNALVLVSEWRLLSGRCHRSMDLGRQAV